MLVKNESGGQNRSQLPSAPASSSPPLIIPTLIIPNPPPASQPRGLAARRPHRVPRGSPPTGRFRTESGTLPR